MPVVKTDERIVTDRNIISFSIDEVRMLLLKKAAEDKLLDPKFVLQMDEVQTNEDLFVLTVQLDSGTQKVSAINLIREFIVEKKTLGE